MTDLKPCPFCGDQPRIDTAGGTAIWPICGACENEKLSNAVYRWNTRPREAQLEAGIAELRAKLAVYESAVWCADTHNKIIKRLMADVGMPNSMSLYGAFKQFANELHALSTKREEG